MDAPAALARRRRGSRRGAIGPTVENTPRQEQADVEAIIQDLDVLSELEMLQMLEILQEMEMLNEIDPGLLPGSEREGTIQ